MTCVRAVKSDIDDSRAFRRSRREGVCGSSGLSDMHINGKNRLACATNINDSRDMALNERRDKVDDACRLARCRTIMHCADVSPKNLSPAAAIGQVRSMLVARAV